MSMINLNNIQKPKDEYYDNVDLMTPLRDQLLNDITPIVIQLQLFLHRHSNDITEKENDKILQLQTNLFDLGTFIKDINN